MDLILKEDIVPCDFHLNTIQILALMASIQNEVNMRQLFSISIFSVGPTPKREKQITSQILAERSIDSKIYLLRNDATTTQANGMLEVS